MSYLEITNIIKEFFEKHNILSRLSDIEEWRNKTADPSIKINVDNIQKINTNITKELLPQIQDSANIAKGAEKAALGASNDAISASNIAVDAKNTAEQFLTRIQEAETNATNAATNATNAFSQVQDFANRLKAAGEQLQKDLEAILAAESKFRTVLLTELDAIRRQLGDLAEAVKLAGEDVKKEGEDVKTQLDSIINSMDRPISDIKEYLRRLQEDSAVYIPFNAAMVIALIVSSSAVQTVQTFLGDPENPTLYNYYKIAGNGTIVEEIIEGFGKLGVEFIDIGNSLSNFASTINEEFKKLGDRLILSAKLINDAFKEFIDTFHKVFLNLSYSLRGETPPELVIS